MGREIKDISGNTYGYLTAIEFDHRDKKNTYWKFRCRCGNYVIRSMKRIYEVKTPSCGCYSKEIIEEARLRREEKDIQLLERKKWKHDNSKSNRDLTGEKHGRLTVIKLLSEEPGLKSEYLCSCECGANVIKTQRGIVFSSTPPSCGCGRKNAIPKGEYVKRLRSIYCGMIYRCYNPKNSSYKYYGGRGITVSKIWMEDGGFEKFYQWAMHNGYRDDLTIDRINVYGNYTPQNCRWADKETQANNKTTNIKIYDNGDIVSLSQFCKKYNLKYEEMRKLISCECIFSGKYLLER